MVIVGDIDPDYRRRQINDMTRVAMGAIEMVNRRKEYKAQRMDRRLRHAFETAQKDPEMGLAEMESLEKHYQKDFDMNPLKELLGGRADDMDTQRKAFYSVGTKYAQEMATLKEIDDQLAQREQQAMAYAQFDPMGQQQLQKIQQDRAAVQQQMVPDKLWGTMIGSMSGDERMAAETYRERIDLDDQFFQRLGAVDPTRWTARMQEARALGMQGEDVPDLGEVFAVEAGFAEEPAKEQGRKAVWQYDQLKERLKFDYDLDLVDYRAQAELGKQQKLTPILVDRTEKQTRAREEVQAEYADDAGTGKGKVTDKNWSSGFWKDYKGSKAKNKQELDAKIDDLMVSDPTIRSRKQAIEVLKEQGVYSTTEMPDVPDRYKDVLNTLVEDFAPDEPGMKFTPETKRNALVGIVQQYQELIANPQVSPEMAIEILTKASQTEGEIEMPVIGPP